MTVHVSTCLYTDKDSGAQMIGTGVSRYTTDPLLCHIRVTLEPSVDHTPDKAPSFVSLDLALDLGQTRDAESLVSMLSHIHVRSISLDVTPRPLTLISVPRALLCLGCSVGRVQSCFLTIPRTLAASLTHLALHLHPAPWILYPIAAPHPCIYAYSFAPRYDINP